MKKLFLTVITVFMLASCSNNEDAVVEQTQTSIIGKWHLVTAKKNGKDIVLNSCELSSSYEFLENNNCVYEESYLGGDGKCKPDPTNGIFTFKDNILSFKDKEGDLYESRSRITELTANSFKETIYYIREFGNGRWYEEEIPVNEQITCTMERME
jgi:hypothetical protein